MTGPQHDSDRANSSSDAGQTAGEVETITVARGDGIGPEIMDATLAVLEAGGARLRHELVEIGERSFLAGHSSGISPEAWEVIRRNRAFLKAPITTPLGGGYKSLNVTIRKTLNLFANVRPTKAYMPFVRSAAPGLDLVIVRENEEDLYAGIEHRQTEEVTQVLKLVTRPGSERILRYAFEYARAYGRKKVTCMSKNNIMKLTDGLFSRTFEEVAKDYPEIEAEHQIIDIGAARIASAPERYDVVVTLNLYGDIISDIAAEVAGSVGLAGSANIGPRVSMFEAVHGSAPDIAGQGVANPSGLLVAAAQMLVHLGQADAAERIKNAWLCTLEQGIHTGEIYRPEVSKQRVGTQAFAQAVIDRLGETPRELAPANYRNAAGPIAFTLSPPPRSEKALVGIDVFLDWDREGRDPDRLGRGLEAAAPQGWRLEVITNRGVKVYPAGVPETFCTDHWRCRFVRDDAGTTDFGAVLELLGALHGADFEVIKTEHLYTFDGARGFSLAQGA